MSENKGPLRRLVDAVRGAVRTAAAGVGLIDPKAPAESKSARKSARKAAVVRVAEDQLAAKKARRSRS